MAAWPLLVVEPDDRPGYKGCKLVNRGQGVAFQILYWNGELNVRDQGPPIFFVQPSTMGPGNSAYLPIPLAWKAFTVMYKGLDRAERWTIVYLDPQKPQDHVVRKGLEEFYPFVRCDVV